jgi:DNA-binding transcriptional LysR family regulator
VTEAVTCLSRRHPQLQIELIEGDWRRLGPLMVAGNIDLGLFDVRIVEKDNRFVVEPLPAHPGSFFVRHGHPLAGRQGLNIRQVLAYPLVGVRAYDHVLAEAAGPAAGLQIDASTGEIVPRLSTTSAATTRAAVQRTDGVGLAALAQLEDDIRLGRLVTLDVDWPGIRSSYGIVRLRERAPSAAAMALTGCIREVEAERPAQEAAPRPAPRTTALA